VGSWPSGQWVLGQDKNFEICTDFSNQIDETISNVDLRDQFTILNPEVIFFRMRLLLPASIFLASIVATTSVNKP
jgi:hypothetical protein